MPNTIEGLLLVIGALFLMIGLIGGGFEMSAAKIPPVGTKGRIGATIVGALFLTLAIRSLVNRQPPAQIQHADITTARIPEPVPVKDPVKDVTAADPEPEPLEPAPVAPASAAAAPITNKYYRLQLRHNNQFLDAAYCSNTLNLNPGSDFDGGSCELFRFVPTGDGWSRLQLMATGLYLDACSGAVGLSAAQTDAGAACQMWKLVPAGDGWSRLKLKRDGQYLEAANCATTTIGLNAISDLEEGACQLWRLVAQ